MPSATESFKAHFLRSTLASGALAVSNKAFVLVIAILFARILGAEGFGYYTFAIGVLTILAVPAQLGLPQLITREVAAMHAREDWNLLKGLRRRALQVAAIAACAATLIALVLLSFAQHIPAIDPVTFVLAIMLLPLMISMELLAGILRGLRKVVHAMWPVAAMKPGIMVAAIAGVALLGVDPRPPVAMAINIFATLVALVTLIVMTTHFWPPAAQHAEPEYRAKEWLRSLLPFSMLGAANLITQKTDIVMLGLLTTPTDVGIYQVVLQGAMLVSFGFMAMNAVLAPNIARLYAHGDTARLGQLMVISSAIVLSIAILAMILLALFGKQLLGLVFGSDFRRGYPVLMILGFGQLVNASVGSVGTFLSMTGNEKDTLRAIVTAAIVNVALNAMLIPPFGIIGAAVATMIATVLWNGMMAVAVHRRLGLLPGPIAAIWKK